MQNYPTTQPAPPIADSDPSLESALLRLARDGWRFRGPMGPLLQFERPKHFNAREGVLLAIVCAGLVLLAGVAGILLAFLLALGDLIWYAARRDETMLVRRNPATGRYERKV